MDYMKVYMRRLVAKVDMTDNHSPGEMQNIASEIQIKQFNGIISSK